MTNFKKLKLYHIFFSILFITSTALLSYAGIRLYNKPSFECSTEHLVCGAKTYEEIVQVAVGYSSLISVVGKITLIASAITLIFALISIIPTFYTTFFAKEKPTEEFEEFLTEEIIMENLKTNTVAVLFTLLVAVILVMGVS